MVNVIKFIYNFVSVIVTTILFTVFVWIPETIDDLNRAYRQSSFVDFIEDMHRYTVKRIKDNSA